METVTTVTGDTETVEVPVTTGLRSGTMVAFERERKRKCESVLLYGVMKISGLCR